MSSSSYLSLNSSSTASSSDISPNPYIFSSPSSFSSPNYQFSPTFLPEQTLHNSRNAITHSRIDPERAPYPQHKKFITYVTQAGSLPPSSISPFLSIDQGCCRPQFIRFTTTVLANTNKLTVRSCIGIGAIITPFAKISPLEESIKIVDMGEDGPIRCTRCKAYINPFCRWGNEGRSFKCNLCYTISTIPEWYRCYLDENNSRRDIVEHPELTEGSVDFLVPSKLYPSLYHHQNQTLSPYYLFVIEASPSFLSSKMLSLVTETISNILFSLSSVKPYLNIGFLTFNESLHFWRLSLSFSTPQIYIINSPETFLPLPLSELFLPLHSLENIQYLQNILKEFPSIIAESFPSSSLPDYHNFSFDSVLNLVNSLLSSNGGKALFFYSSLSSLDSHHTNILTSEYYQLKSKEMAKNSISCDLFVFFQNDLNLQNIYHLTNNTNGQIFFYNFLDTQSFSSDLNNNLMKDTYYDCSLTIRCGTGLSVDHFIGNYYQSNINNPELYLPMTDSEKTIAVILKHEGDIDEKVNPETYIQFAILYSSKNNQRFIRVHNIALKISNNLSSVLRGADCECIIALSLRQAISASRISKIQTIKTALTLAVIDILSVYRLHCATNPTSQNLILPESLRLLPFYTLCLLKHCIFSPSPLSSSYDWLIHLSSQIYHLSLPSTISFLSPYLYSLNDIISFDIQTSTILPHILPPSINNIDSSSVYLLVTPIFLFLYIGTNFLKNPSLSPSHQLFQINNNSQFELLPPSDNHQSPINRFYCFLQYLQHLLPYHRDLKIISPSQSSFLSLFQHFLITDPSPNLSHQHDPIIYNTKNNNISKKKSNPSSFDHVCHEMSYFEYLCYLHRYVKKNMIHNR